MGPMSTPGALAASSAESQVHHHPLRAIYHMLVAIYHATLAIERHLRTEGDRG